MSTSFLSLSLTHSPSLSLRYCHLLLVLTLFLWAPVSGGCVLPWCPVECVLHFWTNKLIDRLIDWEVFRGQRWERKVTGRPSAHFRHTFDGVAGSEGHLLKDRPTDMAMLQPTAFVNLTNVVVLLAILAVFGEVVQNWWLHLTPRCTGIEIFLWRYIIIDISWYHASLRTNRHLKGRRRWSTLITSVNILCFGRRLRRYDLRR